ncbi:MAG: DUF5702 domain-containing protein [Lachnospiraceae bacterium]|nr:DUF5702 domain-containing protein [Lachnospiraceae bacterium]
MNGITTYKHNNAYITVLLTLIMTVLLSLCLTQIEGTRAGAVRLEAQIKGETAMNSVLAEYHRQLLARYNLFAVDCSYGGRTATPENTAAHLKEYLDLNLNLKDLFLSEYLYRDFLGMKAEKVQIPGVLFLTDRDGKVLRQRCAEAVRDDLFLEDLQLLLDFATVVEAQELESMDIYGAYLEAEQEVESRRKHMVIVDEEEVPVEYNSPFAGVLSELSGNLLNLTVGGEISEKSCEGDALFSDRKKAGQINVGNMEPEKESFPEEATERLLFQGYIGTYFGCYTDPLEGTALDYEMEHLLCGKRDDRRDFLGTLERLYALRSAIDYICIRSDAGKRAAAEALAVVLAFLVLTPELEEVFREVILLGWSLVEAAGDVKTLCKGGKVPFWKGEGSWGSSLESAMSGAVTEGRSEGGLDYEAYLQIFLFLMGAEKLTDRVADLMEANIRQTPGNAGFRMDGCIDRFEAQIRFDSAGGQVSLTRIRGYD